MSLDNGYIKLWRSVLTWEWYDDPPTKDVYIHFMLMASISKSTWHGIEIPRGGFVSSYAKIAEQTGLTIRQTRTAINHLETTGEELEAKHCPYCKGRDKFTFSINIKTGAFNCFRASCGKHGHFVELCRDFDYPLAEETTYRQLPQPKHDDIVIRDSAIEYMAGRGISKETCQKYFITARNDKPDIIVFPFYDENNTLQFIKYRNTKYVRGMSGSKEFCETRCKPILFGMWQCMDNDNKTCVITEGQIDSLTLAECGIENALSVPTGCSGFTWVQHCIDWLQTRFTKIIVFGDYENGRMTLIDEIKKRIKVTDGIYRVQPKYYLYEKDANDIFRKYGRQAVIDAAENAVPASAQYSKRLADVKPMDTLHMSKIKTMIPSIDRIIGGLFLGQVILLSGKRGDGKSTFMSQLVANAIEQGVKTYIYSGELPNYMFKHWLDLQIAGSSRISVQHDKDGFEHCMIPKEVTETINRWYYNKAFIFDNTAIDDDFDSLISEITKQILLFDVQLICIDNLMIAMDDGGGKPNDFYQAQSAFVKKLAKLARQYNVAIVLVAHPKKGEEFTNDMVSGSADITNAVDVVMAYIRAGKDDIGFESKLIVTKNRINGICISAESPVKLNFSPHSKRIIECGKSALEYSAFAEPKNATGTEDFYI